jgi:hypothetical protein
LAGHDILYNGIQQGCRGCHIPHGGSVKTSGLATRVTVYGTGVNDYSTGTYKLWDKNLSTGSYQTYSSDYNETPAGILNMTTIRTLQATLGDTTNPAWHSYLCFSCHDGLVAGLNLPGPIVTNLTNNGDFPVNDPSNPLDIDLTNDHPVDIPYPTADVGATGSGKNFALSSAVTGGTSGYDLQGLPLYGVNNALECATCHNPHYQPISTVGNGNFLRMGPLSGPTVTDNTSLCRVCHVSKR